MAKLFEKQDYPVEFLKDPSSWLPAEQLENFLMDFAEHIGEENPKNYYREVGRHNFKLRAWGVLDSVLKMVASPIDIFAQPERFLSYFMSPPPPIRLVESGADKVVFQLGFDREEFPLATAYIRGAVEGLPQYMSLPNAEISSDGENWTLSWSNDHQSLFNEKEQNHRQWHPEIVHSVMESLQAKPHPSNAQTPNGHGITSDEKGPSIGSIELEERIQAEVQKRVGNWAEKKEQFDGTLFQLKNDFYKLYDYFTRAQQLVTLIGGSAKKAQAKEAMRRVDWAYVQNEFPKMIEEACQALVSLKEVMADEELPPKNNIIVNKESVNLNELIDQIIEGLSLGTRQLKIDKHWLLDKPVPVYTAQLTQALKEVFDISVSKSRNGDEVRVVTRPNGRKVEIEITDTGRGYDEETLMNVFSEDASDNLSETQKIIREHEGNISISSRTGQGATFLIELPL